MERSPNIEIWLSVSIPDVSADVFVGYTVKIHTKAFRINCTASVHRYCESEFAETIFHVIGVQKQF